jgi:hypothetical protein
MASQSSLNYILTIVEHTFGAVKGRKLREQDVAGRPRRTGCQFLPAKLKPERLPMSLLRAQRLLS